MIPRAGICVGMRDIKVYAVLEGALLPQLVPGALTSDDDSSESFIRSEGNVPASPPPSQQLTNNESSSGRVFVLGNFIPQILKSFPKLSQKKMIHTIFTKSCISGRTQFQSCGSPQAQNFRE
eukprot:scaffold38884_cov66-Attheya_sp.AAC.6